MVFIKKISVNTKTIGRIAKTGLKKHSLNGIFGRLLCRINPNHFGIFLAVFEFMNVL